MTFQATFPRPSPTAFPTVSNVANPASLRVCSPTLYTTYIGGLPPVGWPTSRMVPGPSDLVHPLGSLSTVGFSMIDMVTGRRGVPGHLRIRPRFLFRVRLLRQSKVTLCICNKISD